MAQTFNTNTIKVTENYLSLLQVPYTKKFVKKQLLENTYFPSLFSLSSLFDKFNIDNKAYRVTDEEFDNLQAPFIAFASDNSTGKDFVLVQKITNHSVTYLADKVKTIPKQDFLKNWHRVIFLGSKNQSSVEPNYIDNLKVEQKIRQKKIGLTSISIIVFISFAVNYFNNAGLAIKTSTIFISTVLGLFISLLLLIFDIDKTNTFIKNICTRNKKTNCSAVLNSKGSKILGMTWSEVGFFYFSSTLCFLLFPIPSLEIKANYIAIVSILTALYIPFSLYYQYKVVRQWCSLCNHD